jgi:hypothetical protein
MARGQVRRAPARDHACQAGLISVAEYESMQETLDILSDEETLTDLRQSRADFAAGDAYSAVNLYRAGKLIKKWLNSGSSSSAVRS